MHNWEGQGGHGVVRHSLGVLDVRLRRCCSWCGGLAVAAG
jgi:hypothetical protein